MLSLRLVLALLTVMQGQCVERCTTVPPQQECRKVSPIEPPKVEFKCVSILLVIIRKVL
jgi:hypothetical protein